MQTQWLDPSVTLKVQKCLPTATRNNPIICFLGTKYSGRLLLCTISSRAIPLLDFCDLQFPRVISLKVCVQSKSSQQGTSLQDQCTFVGFLTNSSGRLFREKNHARSAHCHTKEQAYAVQGNRRTMNSIV